MSTYVPVKKSQIYHLQKTPLYIQNAEEKFILFKSANMALDTERFTAESSPRLYIPEEMRESAVREIRKQLKRKLKEQMALGDLKMIKSAICNIVEESFQEPLAENLQLLPDTIDIVYEEYADATKLLNSIQGLRFGGTALVEHSANVMLLALNFCLFTNLTESEAKRISLCALLHDIGLTRIPAHILEAKANLSDADFDLYKQHARFGYDIIRENEHIDPSVATGVIEHHERINGEGYPDGVSTISYEGRLVGVIECFDSLTTSEREDRKKKEPFGAMKTIQQEIVDKGSFDKAIFRDLCLSLLGKRSYM